MSTVTRRVETALPETGSREWWALYLLAPLVLIGGGLLVFPTLVYDQFIWQYLWGPVVADAASQPVTHEGIRAVRGYFVVTAVTVLALGAGALARDSGWNGRFSWRVAGSL